MRNVDIAWYAIRVTYSREMKLKNYLDNNKIENFIPMRHDFISRGRKKVRKLVPVVHNLIFIKSTRRMLDQVKSRVESFASMRYIINKADNLPIVIPDKQMQNFITISATMSEQLVYLDPAELTLKKGDKVRVSNGIFLGVEGEFIRIKGDRRIVVSIPGIMGVATAYIHPTFLEKISYSEHM